MYEKFEKVTGLEKYVYLFDLHRCLIQVKNN